MCVKKNVVYIAANIYSEYLLPTFNKVYYINMRIVSVPY